MSRHGKLVAKLISQESEFTWPELVSLLQGFGFQPVQGSGSRVKFHNGNPAALISLHRPHPGSEIKPYIRRQIIAQLKNGGLLP
ncbi:MULTISPECIES: type II toxin-antitoxin system HicA family toxin [unclassified Pseudomonas]|jgi:predicted RNA binding protein YcfA (HicA-like mRNA interferase family)|uniref:type II toxin-antitoxin system HicA family toxin n=1 Tax=unclassified Pseudomonas TaxID=196821 RepID=UPI000F04C38B|nr:MULTISPECIES: type II toxin-antitoxin system HicA family toxin [unclassified Pseudomonas]MBD8593841.1 type II toxin-antitoxin system HicA family toxin [Pseudomonas sp. CFBP 8758]MBD8603653.1 type II toxin-antitoxin system HicA family toxin [Pseudomonas sp. CFBP 8771]MBD8623648.1 type II toxin-antitoxin system HicA family toxin [Pseudomonas sp. CFBP 13727]MBD8683412.1 type II toxin-antitoxin system HicA family toxin [Pseudomonas sp. CFBP 13719]MBD8731433.1 type II toxin-antitoxin system HicA